ncbi:MAG: glycine cleavage T C-terminal barrel domain-containing protein, partial [Aestuariivirgaceae bacterium]
GLVTSGAHGHRTGKNLAFAYIDPKAIKADKEFTVEICGTSFTASLLTTPPYDPGNLLLRAG